MHSTLHVVSQITRGSAATVALFCLMAAGCAKTGDPQPPVVNVLRPVTDLQVRQFGERVILVLTIPTEFTTGSSAPRVEAVELLKVAEPDRTPTAALPEASFVEKASVVTTLPADKVAAEGKNGRLVIEEDLTRTGSKPYAGAYRYAVRFLNRRNETAGLSNQAFIAPIPLPRIPTQARFDLNQDRIRLMWDAPTHNIDGSQPANVEGYNIYRAEGPDAFGGAPLNSKPATQPEFEDRNFEFDKTYFYKVSIVGRSAAPYAETTASPSVEVVARDTFPPGAPPNLNAVVESGVVFLLWSAPPQNDVAGYRIYRSTTGAIREQIEKELVREPSYRDTKVQSGRSYTYAVHAVDTHGNEGPASETTIGIP